MVDLGRNEFNVNHLRKLLTTQSADSPHRMVPLCVACGYPAVEVNAAQCSECGGEISAEAAHGHESGTSFAQIAMFTAFAIVVYGLLSLSMGDVFTWWNALTFALTIIVCLPGFYLWTIWQRKKRRRSES